MKSANKSNNDALAAAKKVIRPGNEPASTTELHAKAWRRAATIFNGKICNVAYTTQYGPYVALAAFYTIMANAYEEATDG